MTLIPQIPSWRPRKIEKNIPEEHQLTLTLSCLDQTKKSTPNGSIQVLTTTYSYKVYSPYNKDEPLGESCLERKGLSGFENTTSRSWLAAAPDRFILQSQVKFTSGKKTINQTATAIFQANNRFHEMKLHFDILYTKQGNPLVIPTLVGTCKATAEDMARYKEELEDTKNPIPGVLHKEEGDGCKTYQLQSGKYTLNKLEETPGDVPYFNEVTYNCVNPRADQAVEL